MAISKPIIEVKGGAYRFLWCEGEEWVYVATISRLRENRHSLVGEITLEVAHEEAPVLSCVRFTLTSPRSRDTLAKRLGRVSDLVNWGELIDMVSTETIKEYRKGEPISWLGNIPEIKETEYQLFPILLKEEPNLIYGAGGVGKSYLAAYFAILVKYGMDPLGLQPQQGNVLILDWETSGRELERRIFALKQGLVILPGKDIAYRFCHQSLADDIVEIQQRVDETQASLVIVDSVGAACGAEPESAEVVLRYFSALRSLRVTTLSIDHIPKEGKGPFGSVYKFNAARSIFEIKANQEAGENLLTVGLYHRKMNTGKLLKPMGFQFEFDQDEVGEVVRVNPADLADIPELAGSLALRDRIAKALGLMGNLSVAEISEQTDASQATVRTTLYRNKQKFVRLGKDSWGLLMIGEES